MKTRRRKFTTMYGGKKKAGGSRFKALEERLSVKDEKGKVKNPVGLAALKKRV